MVPSPSSLTKSAPSWATATPTGRSQTLWSLTTALDRFLAAPGKDVPGTAMPISTPSANDRADLIAYLATATVTAPTPK